MRACVSLYESVLRHDSSSRWKKPKKKTPVKMLFRDFWKWYPFSSQLSGFNLRMPRGHHAAQRTRSLVEGSCTTANVNYVMAVHRRSSFKSIFNTFAVEGLQPTVKPIHLFSGTPSIKKCQMVLESRVVMNFEKLAHGERAIIPHPLIWLQTTVIILLRRIGALFPDSICSKLGMVTV